MAFSPGTRLVSCTPRTPISLQGARDRFNREAQVLASLNHPNIAHVHGFEAATLPDGSTVNILAMELVEGEDLSERLRRGAIPVDEALVIAKQIAPGRRLRGYDGSGPPSILDALSMSVCAKSKPLYNSGRPRTLARA